MERPVVALEDSGPEIYSFPSSMLSKKRMRENVRNACLYRDDSEVYIRARQSVDGYPVQELELRQIRRETVAVYMLVGV